MHVAGVVEKVRRAHCDEAADEDARSAVSRDASEPLAAGILGGIALLFHVAVETKKNSCPLLR